MITKLSLAFLSLGLIWVVPDWTANLVASGGPIVKWIMGIVLYFAAQFLMGVVVGRVIRGPQTSV